MKDCNWKKKENWLSNMHQMNEVLKHLRTSYFKSFKKDKVIEYKLKKSSDWKLSKVNGCRTEMVHFWPHVGKSKMDLRGGRFS